MICAMHSNLQPIEWLATKIEGVLGSDSGRPCALFEAALDHGVHHLLHDLLVGLVLRLDHDRLLLLRGELVGIHFCVAFCVLCCAVL